MLLPKEPSTLHPSGLPYRPGVGESLGGSRQTARVPTDTALRPCSLKLGML